ncbi:MAG: hypothetical protein QOI45_1103 [Thermoleophilaceae bacterium]|nr:hypothetical protein [Thermoleophilaceae bacterium]
MAVGGLAALAPACGGHEQGASGDRTEPLERTPLNRPGDSGRETRSACTLLRPREIARILRRPGIRFTASRNDSTDLTICDWRGAGLRVQLIVDSAPRAQLRYYNQLAEQFQFHNTEPERRPYQLERVGDDDAYGGAGAWWTRSKAQLVGYADERILRVRAPTRQAAVKVARRAFRRLSEPGR